MLATAVRFTSQCALITACVLSSIALAQTDAEHFFQQIDSLRASHVSGIERMETLSAMFKGAPYVDGNLGEGSTAKYDRDPLYRFDVFDCTTYVETVLAGTISASANEFASHMQKIRYQDGQVSFVSRNHFASADWLPNNQWLLTDISAEVGQAQTLTATTLIDKPAWYQMMSDSRLQGLPEGIDRDQLLATLRQEGARFKAQTVNTPYVPLSAVFQGDSINQALLDRIPSGSIISMVRPDYDVTKWIGTHLNVTHQAIALRQDGQLFLRHASQLKKEVTDENFVAYFEKYRSSATLKGFNVQQPNF